MIFILKSYTPSSYSSLVSAVTYTDRGKYQKMFSPNQGLQISYTKPSRYLTSHTKTLGWTLPQRCRMKTKLLCIGFFGSLSTGFDFDRSRYLWLLAESATYAIGSSTSRHRAADSKKAWLETIGTRRKKLCSFDLASGLFFTSPELFNVWILSDRRLANCSQQPTKK